MQKTMERSRRSRFENGIYMPQLCGKTEEERTLRITNKELRELAEAQFHPGDDAEILLVERDINRNRKRYASVKVIAVYQFFILVEHKSGWKECIQFYDGLRKMRKKGKHEQCQSNGKGRKRPNLQRRV